MTTKRILWEEAARLAAGMLPLAALTLAVFAMCGQLSLRVVWSLAAGMAYAFGLFLWIGFNAQKALLFPPAYAVRIVRHGYVLRFLLTGAVITLALQCPLFHPVAAIVPLFYHKAILLANNLIPRKGG